MMKKLFALLVVLALCGLTNAALVISLDGEGTAIAATTGTEYTIMVNLTGGTLFGFDAKVTVGGDAAITGAMSSADAGNYGWDPMYAVDPVYGTGYVDIGGAKFEGNTSANIGYVKVTYGSGTVTVGIQENSTQFCLELPDDYSNGVVTLIPEPMSIALLALGGLFIRRRK